MKHIQPHIQEALILSLNKFKVKLPNNNNNETKKPKTNDKEKTLESI